MSNLFLTYLKQSNISFLLNEPLKKHTSFKIGGNAEFFILPSCEEQCVDIIKKCRELSVPYIIIGKGSNLLVSDNGFFGAVICVSNLMSSVYIENEDIIVCQAGASLSNVCLFALKNSLEGLEFAYGIPGNIGGAIAMNAGAYGGEIKDVLVSCKFIDSNGNIFEKKNEELNFSYRKSIFSDKNYCIVSAKIKLKPAKKQEIQAKMNDYISRRKSKQPLEFPSAGSTFKRPTGSYASMLIDECGLKGLTVGGAQVSEKHAGFVINRNSASFNDVMEIIDKITDTVFKKTGYKLEPEVKIIN